MDALDARETQRGQPQKVAEFPRRCRELVVPEPPPRFEHLDAVPLLDEPQGGDRPAEPGPDDDDIDVAGSHAASSLC